MTAGRSPRGPGPAGQFWKLTFGNSDLLPSEAPWAWGDHLGPPLALRGPRWDTLRPLTADSQHLRPSLPQPLLSLLNPVPARDAGQAATRLRAPPAESRSFEPWVCLPGLQGARVRAPPLRGLAMSIGCTQRPQCTSEPTRPPVFLCLLSRSVPVNFRALHGPDPSRKCLFCAAPAWAGAPPILCSRLTLQVSARRQQACLKFCHRTTLSPWPQMRITCPLIHPVVPLCDPHGPQPARLRCPWYSPGKDTGVGCHFLLQGVFQTQGLNLCLLHGQVGHPAQISVCQEHLTGNLARRRGLTGLLDPIFIFTIDSVISYFFLISLCLHIF